MVHEGQEVGIINNKQLNSLIKTVECGSFAKAEEELFVSRQALKKQIDSLEEELGFTLLIRTHQGVALTPAGEEFCRSVKGMLSETESTIQRCKELALSEDVIRIASPYHPRLLLENAFAEFYRRFPNIKQQVILQQASRTIESIVKGQTDVAEFIYRPGIEDSGLQYLKLFPLPYKCLVAPSHPLAGSKSIHPEDLSNCSIYLHKGDNTLVSQLGKCGNGAEIPYQSIENDMQKITNACYNGGVFISKAYFLNSMQPLISIPLEIEHVPMAIILYRKSPAPNTKKFLNVIKELYPQ